MNIDISQLAFSHRGDKVENVEAFVAVLISMEDTDVGFYAHFHGKELSC